MHLEQESLYFTFESIGLYQSQNSAAIYRIILPKKLRKLLSNAMEQLTNMDQIMSCHEPDQLEQVSWAKDRVASRSLPALHG